jgi:uncharacterized protein (DUF433 family)
MYREGQPKNDLPFRCAVATMAREWVRSGQALSNPQRFREHQNKSHPRAVREAMKIKWQDYIEERKGVMLGKPIFKGTRLTVEHILRQLGAGMSHDELLEQYPTLKPKHIRAAMAYAADVLTMDESIYQ